jgi:preprotein translocase subunit SecA
VKKVLKRVLGDPQVRTIKRMRKRVKEVNALDETYKKLTDKQLQDQTEKLKNA